MDTPGLVTRHLGEEEPFSRVPLGGDDLLLVTETRTIVYRAEGILRDESVASYPHDCDRIAVSQGRRKATLRFEYLEGNKDFSVPLDTLGTVLPPIVRGVLTTEGVVDEEERIIGVYRFSELTLIVTDRRVIKHVGATLWDEEYETFPYADLTGLGFTKGSVATEVVIEVDGRPDRFKAPNDEARFVQRDLERAVLDYHEVDSLAELNAMLGPEEDRRDPAAAFATDDLKSLVPDRDEPSTATESAPETVDATAESEGGFSFDRIDTGRSNDEAVGGDAAAATEPTTSGTGEPSDDVTERLAALEESVERQREVIERQADLLEDLVEELRRGR